MAGFLMPFTLSLLTLSLTFPVLGNPHNFLKSVSLSPFKLEKEKLSHLQFYWHDISSGTNSTSTVIVQPSSLNNSSIIGFGSFIVSDSPITEKPEIESKMLGRAQGFYGVASQKEIAFLMMMNFVFTTGRYNGSTFTVMGRNAVNEKVREMPVVGGTGQFQFAKGYVEASTYKLNNKTRNAVMYNVSIVHY